MATPSSPAHSTASEDDIARPLSERWGWLLALAIVQVLAGLAAIALPSMATMVATLVFGWVLLIAAVFHVVHAITVRRWRGFALHLLGGLLYGAAGILILLNPLSGALSLTLVLAALLLIEGILRSALAFNVRPHDGWGWFLAGGIMSLLLGALLLAGWPATALWAIGTLVGIQLLFSGAMNLAFAFACRRHCKSAGGHVAAAH